MARMLVRRAAASLRRLAMAALPEATIAPPPAPHLVTASSRPGAASVALRWSDGHRLDLHTTWLRDNCHCSVCMTSSGQRALPASALPVENVVASVTVLDDEKIAIKWAGDAHQTELDSAWIRQVQAPTVHALPRAVPVPPVVPFSAVATSEDGVYSWLKNIYDHGFCIVRGAPTMPGVVVDLADEIAFVQETIYGRTFEVEAVPNPINVAYSNVALELHQDLVYYESPPGLQFLHCLEFDDNVIGGESTILDLLAAAERLREIDLDAFEALCRIPATFQKIHYNRNRPVEMISRRPHISLDDRGQVCSVFWAPPFEGPLQLHNPDDVARYYRAKQRFVGVLCEPGRTLSFRLQPGDVLTFNNRRMAHGRTAFNTREPAIHGARHFQGAYVGINEFKSRFQVLNRKYGDGRYTLPVGDSNWEY